MVQMLINKWSRAYTVKPQSQQHIVQFSLITVSWWSPSVSHGIIQYIRAILCLCQQSHTTLGCSSSFLLKKRRVWVINKGTPALARLPKTTPPSKPSHPPQCLCQWSYQAISLLPVCNLQCFCVTSPFIYVPLRITQPWWCYSQRVLLGG